MKSGRAHSIPITPLLAKLLDRTPDRGGGLVFPSGKRLGGATMISGWSKLLARLRKVSKIPDVGLHTLRRTYRSILADRDFASEPLAEAMIAHRRPDLVSRYNKAALWDLRVAAAGKFDAYLTALVGRADSVADADRALDTDNVVSIATARAPTR
jgi:integrase